MKTIAILGAECSGKTALCKALSQKLHCTWVLEYARTWVEENRRSLEYADVPQIFEGQRQSIESAKGTAYLLRDADWILLDTTLLQTRIYSDFYFGKSPTALMEAAEQERCDVYFVTDPGIAWVSEPGQRGLEKNRQAIHLQILRALESRAIPYEVLSGTIEQRVLRAMQVIQSLDYSPKK